MDKTVSDAPRVSSKLSRASKHVGGALRLAGLLGLVGSLGALAEGCLSRPAINQEPTTKTNFTAVVRQASIDKVDLLVMIDNSASMGDKQEILRLAVPDLVNRLVNPFCVRPDGSVVSSSVDGKCNEGKIEFPPVHDMHLGIVTSSLGGKGGDQCDDQAPSPLNPQLDRHNNDRAHLINRAGDNETPVQEAQPTNFLAWFPQVEANDGKPVPPVTAIRQAEDLAGRFQELVSGVHEYGCGYEAMLESWYRFLVQPDPYEKVDRDGNRAILTGVDKTILKQRKDFLRPDSLVAIIMITDETENMVDPLSVNGQGWAFVNSSFPGSPSGSAARGTSACDVNPNDPNCRSCGFRQDPNDPNCQNNQGYYDSADDNLNVRPIQTKRRFGVDPFFPVSRYIKGLSDLKVPNRDGEHPPVQTQGGAVVPAGNYAGNANCTNPLYAASLPDDYTGTDADAIKGTLCNLSPGTRTPDLVFFAVIGGVPWQLLTNKLAGGAIELKSRLTDDDWTAIVGKDPLNFNYQGIDQHMVESIVPRTNQLLSAVGAVDAINKGGQVGLPQPGALDDADPVHGREWDNGKGDLQYACTFKLPRSVKFPAGQRDCADPKFAQACDCTKDKTPPLCGDPVPNGGGARYQIRGKAYPTWRHLVVARALGEQAIVSSICPIHETPDDLNVQVPTEDEIRNSRDPLFGYRPAVKSIIDRLKNALASQCLPQALNRSPQTPEQEAEGSGAVSCLILETLIQETRGQEACDDQVKYPGRRQPDAKVLQKFKEEQRATAGAPVGDAGSVADKPLCQIDQIIVKPGQGCAEDARAGWCYVTNKGTDRPAGDCPQAILFSQSGNPKGPISLQCIRSNEGAPPVSGGGADGG